MSFTTIYTGASALRHSQTGMDITSQNLANADVDGYSRRRVEGKTLGGVNGALWSRTQTGPLGVFTSSTGRLADNLANSRVRTEHAKGSYLNAKAISFARIEGAIGEPSDTGVAEQLRGVRDAWSAVADHPESAASRAALLDNAAGLVGSVRAQVERFDAEVEMQRGVIATNVFTVNSLASELAEVNLGIASMAGGTEDVSTLLDRRDLISRKLAEITGGVGTINSVGGMDFTIDGASLVAGGKAGTLEIASGAPGETWDTPVAFTLNETTGVPVDLDAVGGELAASVEVVNVTIPEYREKLGAVLSGYADAVNALHTSGHDANGDAGADFFTYDAADPAGTFTLNVTDPSEVAAASQSGAIEGNIADQLADLDLGERTYADLVVDFGARTAAVERAADSQSIYVAQVDGAQAAISGVSTDEEMLNLITYQRAYEAAARVITVADSVLDTLINRTGLLR